MTKKDKQFIDELLAEIIKANTKIYENHKHFTEWRVLGEYKDIILAEKLRYEIQLEGFNRIVDNKFPRFSSDSLISAIRQINSELIVIDERLNKGDN
ncbi:MAG: hypothetical protein PHW73_05965 [Atribacterota bacterium]|nr:hypothetical protein [Atribacterota bacterium]